MEFCDSIDVVRFHHNYVSAIDARVQNTSSEAELTGRRSHKDSVIRISKVQRLVRFFIRELEILVTCIVQNTLHNSIFYSEFVDSWVGVEVCLDQG